MRKTLLIGTLGLLALAATSAGQPADTTKEQTGSANAPAHDTQVATTRPAETTTSELAALRSTVARLRAENAQLKAEIAKLKAAQATAAPAQRQAGMGGPAYEIKRAMPERGLTNGMTVAEAERALGVKLRQIADSSEGTTYRAVVPDKARPNPNTGATVTGTEYTISIRDGVISDWRSRRYFIGTDGMSHYQQ